MRRTRCMCLWLSVLWYAARICHDLLWFFVHHITLITHHYTTLLRLLPISQSVRCPVHLPPACLSIPSCLPEIYWSVNVYHCTCLLRVYVMLSLFFTSLVYLSIQLRMDRAVYLNIFLFFTCLLFHWILSCSVLDALCCVPCCLKLVSRTCYASDVVWQRRRWEIWCFTCIWSLFSQQLGTLMLYLNMEPIFPTVGKSDVLPACGAYFPNS